MFGQEPSTEHHKYLDKNNNEITKSRNYHDRTGNGMNHHDTESCVKTWLTNESTTNQKQNYNFLLWYDNDRVAAGLIQCCSHWHSINPFVFGSGIDIGILVALSMTSSLEWQYHRLWYNEKRIILNVSLFKCLDWALEKHSLGIVMNGRGIAG